MPAFFTRARAKRQRLSDSVEPANDGLWTPGMGEASTASMELPAPTPLRNPKIIANPKFSGRATATVTVSAPTTVTLTPSVILVTVTSLVEFEATSTLAPLLPSPSAIATDGPLFDGESSSSVIKIAGVASIESAAALPTATAEVSSASVLPTEGESVFASPTMSQIADGSTSSDSLSAAASTTSAATVSTISVTLSDELVFSSGNSTRIAAVVTSSVVSPTSTPAVITSSAPLATSATGSERIFATPSTRIAAVSTSNAIASSQLSAVSASLLSAFSVSAASVASSSSVSLASAESSRSVASRAATFNDGPTPSPGTYIGAPSASGTASSIRNREGAGTAGESSAGQLFGSIPRSPASITLTVIFSIAIVLILLVVAFFTRRCYRRRQREVGHRQLGSEGGTPRAGGWGEKDMEEKGRRDYSDDEVDDEAIWRRRVNRINSVDSQRAAPSRPHVSVAPNMSPISEQHTSSDWTSFVGDGEWATLDGRSRMGSVDTTASVEPLAPALPVTKGLGVDTSKAPHPLRTSWFPSFDSPSSQYSPDEESLVAGSPFTPQPREQTPSPTRPTATLKRTPSNIQQSLDRLVGSAAEYLGGLFSDDTNSNNGKSDDVDHYTAFKSPRKAPPTPTIVPPTPSLYSTSPTQVDVPAFPDRAATYTAAAPEELTRPGASRGASLDRSPSDGEQFLGVAHAHVARNVRGKLGFGREKGMKSGDVTSWMESASKESREHDSLLDGSDPAEQDASSIDPFDDSHAAPPYDLEPPHNPPSSPRNRTDTPPPRVGQPLIPFLSPFGPPRPRSTHDEDKDHYSSDDTTSTVKVQRPLSMATLRPAPRKSLPLANSLLARRLSTLSTNSSSDGESPPTAERHRTFSESQIVFRPRPISHNSTDTFGSRESETEESSTESGGSDESDSSRTKRERMKRVEKLKAEERARGLMAERRRRSEGELLKRVVV